MKTPDTVEIPEVADESALDLYNGARLKVEVEKVEAEVRSLVFDPSIPKEYKFIGTIARKISGFKVAVDKLGKELVDPIKAQCKEIDAQRKMVKDRMDALRDEFLAPREAFDQAEVTRVKNVAAAIELFQYGHLKIAEFSKPDMARWDALYAKVHGFEISECVFQDRFNEAKMARSAALDLICNARDKWIEDEQALEAGRKALKEQEDKEAGERHAKRQAEAAATAAAKPKAPDAPAAEKPAPESKKEREARVNRAIMANLRDIGLSAAAAHNVVVALYRGQIPHVTTDYNSAL